MDQILQSFETRPHIHFRELRFYTDKLFKGHGNDLRLAITGAFPDRPVLHNHKGESFDYRSPQVRYMVINGIPRLISFNEGLHVVEEIFSTGGKLKVKKDIYSIVGTDLIERIEPVGSIEGLITYKSISPWIALNQRNYDKFNTLNKYVEERRFLERILIGNYLSFCKTVRVRVKDRILLSIQRFIPISTHVVTKEFIGFRIEFVSNILLPELIGLGKMVSKGFGVMKKLNERG